MGVNRRTFLQTLGLTTAGLSLPGTWLPRARAAEDGPLRRFIFCYFSGGWDTLLCLDPRDPSVFTEADSAITRIYPAYEQISADFTRQVITPNLQDYPHMTFGPAAEDFGMAHYDKACVIRGISMNTLTHEVGRRYFITGKEPQGLRANGSSLGTRIVSAQGDLKAIPNLVSRVEAYNDGDPTYASALSVNGVESLIAVLDDGPNAPTAVVRSALSRYRENVAHCDPAFYDRRGFLGLIDASQLKARELVEAGLGDRFRFNNQGDPEIAELRERYGITNLQSPGAQAALAYQAIRYDIAQSITIELASGLDTHDENWATDHPDALRDGFRALSQLVTDLETTPSEDGGSLLDHTTILCFSEFGRTALLNSRGGRDHSLTSSAVMVGAGVPAGTVVGETSNEGMNGYLVDPTTGLRAEQGELLTPTRIHASILEQAGYDASSLRETGMACLKSR